MYQFVFLALSLIVGAGSAFADQCAWNDQSTAQRARGYLAYHTGPVYRYCEPCGDREMKRIVYGRDKEPTQDGRAIHYRMQTSERPKPGETGWMFVFNEGYAGIERSEDLAYLFIRTEIGYVNVGARFSCVNNSYWNPQRLPNMGIPQGVSPYIPFDRAPQIVNDVTDDDFLRAYSVRYPDDPQG